MNKKQYLYSNLFAWGLVLFLITNYIFGWTTPTEDPPGGNVVLETGATPAGSTGYIQFNDAGNLGADSNLFWDNTNKRLGIGTTGPKAKLHILGGEIRMDYDQPIGATMPGGWTVYMLKLDSGWFIELGPAGAQNPKGIKFSLNGNEKMRIDESGNVGIGTTSPGAKLHVNGNIIASTPTADNHVATKQYVDNFTCGNNVNFFYNGKRVTYGTVLNPTTGKCWMDRNLGALRVATVYNDTLAYGDLFQWGRLDDGHQKRNSGTTTTLSSTDDPGHSNFIKSGSSPYDWRSPKNSNLWQGILGFNNPCPEGWRIPTDSEWNAERQSWSSQNYNGAYESPLKLPAASYRYPVDGSVKTTAEGYYWSSTSGYNDTYSYYLFFHSSGAGTYSTGQRAQGESVRCIKD